MWDGMHETPAWWWCHQPGKKYLWGHWFLIRFPDEAASTMSSSSCSNINQRFLSKSVASNEAPQSSLRQQWQNVSSLQLTFDSDNGCPVALSNRPLSTFMGVLSDCYWLEGLFRSKETQAKETPLHFFNLLCTLCLQKSCLNNSTLAGRSEIKRSHSRSVNLFPADSSTRPSAPSALICWPKSAQPTPTLTCLL